MKMRKKLTAALLAAVMLFMAAGCTIGRNNQTAATTTAPVKTTVNVAGLKGPTGIGLVKLMEDNAAGTAANSYKFTLDAAPTDIIPLLTTGAADIAAMPLNLAATLYKKTNGAVQILAINTLGVLYILDQSNTIKTIADLKGKTIYTSGQGASPEYILNFVLSRNGIVPQKDVTIVYETEHSELAALAAAGKTEICMLPEPFVTTVLSKNPKMRIALDMTKEWESACTKLGLQSTLAMGCLVVRTKFAKNNPDAVNRFLYEYKASVDYVNSNVAAASLLVAKDGIIPSAALAAKAIPNCNIVFISGTEMKTIAYQNLHVLFQANPSSIGGAEPTNDFYYGA